MSDGQSGHHCPVTGVRLLPEPWPAQPSLPVLHSPLSALLPVPRAGQFLHPACEHNEDFNYLQDAQQTKCQTGITPAAGSTLHCTFRLCPRSSPDTDPWRMAQRCWIVPSLSMAVPLPTGSAHHSVLNWRQSARNPFTSLSPTINPAVHQWKQNESLGVSSRRGCQRALVQPPKLTRDTLLLDYISFISILPSYYKPHLLSTLLAWQLKQFLRWINVYSSFLFCSAAESCGSDVRQTNHLLWL